jgi:benzoyl-CoA reductase/2-hydroxyglutaryl-CoA dehydratase subunit BcrC/BadD/HgdB
LQRELNVPLLYLDTPFVHDERPTDAAIAYVRAQLEDMIGAVGDIVGTPIERDRLLEMLLSGSEASSLWGEILDLLAAKPAPISSFDTFIHMAPIVVMRGLQKCIDYYELLVDEVKQRVADGIAAVPGERFRLGWDNIAIWYNLRDMAIKFAKRQACLVAATYTYGWSIQAVEGDFDDPMDALAAGYMGSYVNSGFHVRKKVLASMVEKYDLDGVVMHSNRSCRAYSIGMYDLAKFLEQECNAAVLMIEADHCDPRSFAEEQTFTRIDAFIETVEAREAVA